MPDDNAKQTSDNDAQQTSDIGEQSPEQDSRGRILETTYGLLGSTPYDKLSMQTIADAVGVSKALLFYFFKSKRELVRESLLWGTKREMESFHTLLTEPSDGGTSGGEKEGGTKMEDSAMGLSMPISDILSMWMTNSLERIQILHTYFEVTDIEDPEDSLNIELRSLFNHIIGYLEEVLRENGMAYPREQATLMAVMVDTFGFIPHLTPDPFDSSRYRTAILDLFGFPTQSVQIDEKESDARSSTTKSPTFQSSINQSSINQSSTTQSNIQGER